MVWHNAMKATKLKDGKKKMVTVKRRVLMIGRSADGLFATEALCRHMRWPLAWGGNFPSLPSLRQTSGRHGQKDRFEGL